MPSHYGPDVLDRSLSLLFDPANLKSFSPNENLFTYSEDFSTGWVSAGGASVVTNQAVSPSGTLTADTVSAGAGTAAYLDKNAVLINNTTYVISIYIKPITTNKVLMIEFNPGTGNTYFGVDLATMTIITNGNPVTGGIITLDDGWYRVYWTTTTAATGTPVFRVFYLGAAGTTPTAVSYYLWGAQLEKGTYPSVYTPTTASIVTRPTTITDISGNSRNGTLTNTPLYNPLNNGSIDTNGTSSYIQIPGSASPTGTGDFTLNYWIYLNSNLNGNFGGARKSAALIAGDGTGGSLELFLQTATNVAGPPTSFSVSTYASIGLVGSTTVAVTMPIQVWHNFVVVRDGLSSWKIYHNNVLIGTGNVSTSFPATVVSNIGGLPINNDYSSYFPGRFGYVAYYNRALSATEISNNFNSLRGRFNR